MRKYIHPKQYFKSERKVTIRNIIESVMKFLRLTFKPYEKFEVKPQQWEEQYTEGKWNYLQELNELCRYNVIAGYIEHFTDAASILDVGCGEGVLNRKLKSTGYRKYLGIDVSQAAIKNAEESADSNTKFQQATVDSFSTDEKFDFIIFNECLYYFEDPMATIRKYSKYLEEEGIIIVSMFGDDEQVVHIWNMLDNNNEIDRVMLTNKNGVYWIVKLFRAFH